MKLISGIFSRIIIDYLHNKDTKTNHWIWNTESLQNLPIPESTMGMIYADQIPPHPECKVCQTLEQKKVSILKSQYQLIKQEIAKGPDVETGGILIGQRESDGKYVINRSTGPGPNATKTKTLFEKDEAYCQKELEKSLVALGDKGLYIGEWHYHPVGSNSPSGLSQAMECALTIHDKHGSCVSLSLEVLAQE